MMYFMCFSESDEVFVFSVFEPLKTLMNQNIVNQKVTGTVKRNAASNKKQIIESALNTKVKQDDTRNRKNDKENIIALKSMLVFWLMMIGVKIPHKSVHYIFMRKPSNTFHEQKNA